MPKKKREDAERLEWLAAHVMVFMRGPEVGRFGFEFNRKAEAKKQFYNDFRQVVDWYMDGEK